MSEVLLSMTAQLCTGHIRPTRQPFSWEETRPYFGLAPSEEQSFDSSYLILGCLAGFRSFQTVCVALGRSPSKTESHDCLCDLIAMAPRAFLSS